MMKTKLFQKNQRSLKKRIIAITNGVQICITYKNRIL